MKETASAADLPNEVVRAEGSRAGWCRKMAARLALIWEQIARAAQHYEFLLATYLGVSRKRCVSDVREGREVRAVWSVLASLVLAACSSAAPVAPLAPITVRVTQVTPGPTTASVQGTGTVAYRFETPLGFTSAGRLQKLTVQEGDRVRQGQFLAALDPDPVDADLGAALAEQFRADAEVRRSEKLFAQGWIVKARVESARATAQAAAARVRSTRFQSRNARIFAPTGGEVLTRALEPGQVVAAGTPVLVLGEASGGLVIRIALSDAERGRIARGAQAQIVFAALGPNPIAGNVIELGARAVPTTGAYLAEVLLPPNPLLRSGMIGTATIVAIEPNGPQPLIIPPTSLFAARAGDAFVYVVGNDNVARLRKVNVGEPGDRGAPVLSGLRPGEWVATSSLERLHDGMKIAPVGRER